jgi:hypothetical protein
MDVEAQDHSRRGITLGGDNVEQVIDHGRLL